jgi:uncharacterized alkaline shock family protein YloU
MITIKDNEDGQIQISEDVVAVIANTAACEVDGVVAPEGNFASGIADLLKKRNFTKGVKVEIVDSEVHVCINISVKFGYKIPDVTLTVQKKVKSSIEMMTGLKVVEVDVNIMTINYDKEKKQDKKSDKK